MLILAAGWNVAVAQIPRTRGNSGGPVDEVFWAPAIVTQSSVANLPKGNMNVTIMHAFGLVKSGSDNFFGLDDAANIRIGIDYGVTDRFSLGVGRSKFDKLFDFRFKLNVLRQTRDDRIPLEVAIKGDMGITTLRNGFSFSDRQNFLGSLLIARRFSNRVSLQVAPMYAHFNTVVIRTTSEGVRDQENNHLAVGLGGRLVVTQRLAILLEYLAVVGARSEGTRDEIAVAINIETGGHVFQLFLKTSQWLTEQHAVARNTEDAFAGELRFGFNVNRVFGLGGK